MLFGTLLGALGGLVHAVATVTFGVDHIISGVAINIIAPGLALYLTKVTFAHDPGGGQKQSPPINDAQSITLPFSHWLHTVEDKHWFAVSDLAGVLGGLVTGLSLVTVLAVLVVLASGLDAVAHRVRAAAALLRRGAVRRRVAGRERLQVQVHRGDRVRRAGRPRPARRWRSSAHQFRDGQTGGRGFIGLAALIFGNWRPGALAAGAGLFGYTDAIQLRSSSAVHALLLLVAIALVLVAVWQWRTGQRAIAVVAVVIAALAVLLVRRHRPGAATSWSAPPRTWSPSWCWRWPRSGCGCPRPTAGSTARGEGR